MAGNTGFDIQTLLKFSTLLVLISSQLPHSSSGARILITTPQHGSHVLDKMVLGETLVAKGHDVYIALSSRYPKLSDISKNGVKPLTFHIASDVIISDSKDFHQKITDNVFSGASPMTSSNWASDIVNRDCTYMMEDTNFIEKVKQLNFDLVVSEPFVLSPCNTILPVHLNIPFVTLCGFYLPWEIRSASMPSFVSKGAPYTLENIGKLSMFDKLKNFGWYILLNNADHIIPGRANVTLIKKYAPRYSNWGEIVRTSELYLTQVDHHLGSHVPAFPNYISVGGLTATPAKPLPDDLEKIMQDSGEHGIILASFGATAYYMPENVVKIFFEAFAKLNQTVLARFGVPDGTKVPSNVKLLKWLPQTDILGHRKTKLFITHCGNNGQYEALYHAVPMIGFPMFAEQHDNSVRAEEKGISIGMNILEFTADELVRNVHKVVYTDSYRNKIKEMSERWRDEKFGPRDRAAFWIEHVIKYGGRHLRSPAMKLSVYEFLMLDVILVVLVVLGILACFLRCAGKVICRRFCKGSSKDKVKTN